MYSLYGEVTLIMQDLQDVILAQEILSGKSTVSEVADLKGQETLRFTEGDGDILILSYSRDLDDLNEDDAAKILGNQLGDSRICEYIIPALMETKVQLELVVRYCNLSTKAVVALADAIRGNKHIIGVNVTGNPGNDKFGDYELEQACIETSAPLKWFQGVPLPDWMIRSRLKAAKQRNQDERKSNEDDLFFRASPEQQDRPGLDPITHVFASHPESDDSWDVPSKGRSSLTSGLSERELWLTQMKENMRSTYSSADDGEIDRLVTDIELYELEKRLESIILAQDVEHKMN